MPASSRMRYYFDLNKLRERLGKKKNADFCLALFQSSESLLLPPNFEDKLFYFLKILYIPT